ncbi:hypothetical protein PtB15_3B329 [Puccinia triticina]|nr:hypothetical protein PtB15_3B329 [Puccinia triticina]
MARRPDNPATPASPQKTLAKNPASKTTTLPAKTVVDKHGFASSVVMPYLHDLLQHLSGTPCLVGLEDLEMRFFLELPDRHDPHPSSTSSPAKNLAQKQNTFVQKWNEVLGSFVDHAYTRDWLKSKFMLINDPLVPILQDLNGMVSMIAYQVRRTGQLKFPALNQSALFPTRTSRSKPEGAKPIIMRSRTVASTTLWADALSLAESSVLIAWEHLSSTHHNGIFNLEMAWDLYRQHLKRLSFALDSDPLGNDNRTNDQLRPAVVRSQVYGRDAFELAWERLHRLELILPVGILNSRAAAL